MHKTTQNYTSVPVEIVTANTSTSVSDLIKLFNSFDILITPEGGHLTSGIFTVNPGVSTLALRLSVFCLYLSLCLERMFTQNPLSLLLSFFHPFQIPYPFFTPHPFFSSIFYKICEILSLLRRQSHCRSE